MPVDSTPVTDQPIDAELTEHDFARIGEVMVHASTLENLLIILAAVMLWQARSEGGIDAASIRDEVQDGLRGETAAVSLRTCRLYSHVLEPVVTAEFLQNLWDDCAQLFERRNAIAHSFWERTADGRVVARRALPRHKVEDGVEFVSVGGTLDEMGALRDQFSAAMSDVRRLLDEMWPGTWQGTAALALRPSSMG